MSTPSCVLLAERLTHARAAGAARADVVRQRVFDTLGALAAAREVASSVALAELAGGLGTFGPLDDVRLLCATTRASEVDDISIGGCTTPGSVAVPVALVLAAGYGAEDDALLGGVVAGYEAMVCVGEAINGALRLRAGIWPSHLAAPLSAAAAAAVVLGLDAARCAHALAIAATRAVGAAGRIAAEPTSRWLTYGMAAADGVLAALAAEAGMVGDLNALDVALPAASGVAFDAGRFAALVGGASWGFERVDVKPFVTARQALSPIEAAREAFGSLGSPAVEEIEAISIAVPEAYRVMIDQPAPASRLPSIASAPLGVAAALSFESLLYDVVRADFALPASGQALAAATSVVADESLTSAYPATWGARVRIDLRDGRSASATVVDPDGSAARPPTWEWLARKHERLGGWDSADGLESVLERCRQIGEASPSAPDLLAGTNVLPQELSR